MTNEWQQQQLCNIGIQDHVQKDRMPCWWNSCFVSVERGGVWSLSFGPDEALTQKSPTGPGVEMPEVWRSMDGGGEQVDGQ